MKRRTLLGSAAMTFGGASVLGTNAFTSVEAERSVSVDVVGDASAFLKLEPCDHERSVEVSDEDDEISPEINPSDAVVVKDGMMRIDLTKHNHKLAGHGVTEDSVWRFPNALGITNQGSQPVCVDLCVGTDTGTDACGVPEVGAVDDDDGELDFGEGDPAVILYQGEDRGETFGAGIDTATSPLSLGQGESACVGFDVRTFGLSGNDLSDMTLLIRADTGAECASSSEESTDGDSILTVKNVETYGKSNGQNGDGNRRVEFELSASDDVTITELGIVRASSNPGKGGENNIVEIACEDGPTIESGSDDDDGFDSENHTQSFNTDKQVILDPHIEVSSGDEETVPIGIGEFVGTSGNSSNSSPKNMNQGSATIKFYYETDDDETEHREVKLTEIQSGLE
jgi:hypothetical protein